MIFGQIATTTSITSTIRIGQAAGKLCTARKAGRSDIDAMSEIMFQFSPPLTATEQKSAITSANKLCKVAAVTGQTTPTGPASIPGGGGGGTTTTPPAVPPAPQISPPSADDGLLLVPEFEPAPPRIDTGMSKGTKIAIGVGASVAVVGVLYLLLR
jgi:hypothetical protein